MSVNELIKELQKIDDKEKPVDVWYSTFNFSYITEVNETTDSVELSLNEYYEE